MLWGALNYVFVLIQFQGLKLWFYCNWFLSSDKLFLLCFCDLLSILQILLKCYHKFLFQKSRKRFLNEGTIQVHTAANFTWINFYLDVFGLQIAPMTVYFNKFRSNNILGSLAVIGRDTKKCFLELIQNSQRMHTCIHKVKIEKSKNHFFRRWFI